MSEGKLVVALNESHYSVVVFLTMCELPHGKELVQIWSDNHDSWNVLHLEVVANLARFRIYTVDFGHFKVSLGLVDLQLLCELMYLRQEFLASGTFVVWIILSREINQPTRHSIFSLKDVLFSDHLLLSADDLVREELCVHIQRLVKMVSDVVGFETWNDFGGHPGDELVRRGYGSLIGAHHLAKS